MRQWSRLALVALLGTGLLGASCVGEESEPATGEEANLTAKMLVDLAPELAYGSKSSGFVGGGQLDVYGLSVHKGDRFTVVKKVLDGDLDPDFTLFIGTKVSSDSFDAANGALTKTYTAPASGRALLAVYAHNKVSAGGYAIDVTCTGGPCKGEPLLTPLDSFDADSCIRMGRECAFARMGAFGGLVGPARARSLFQECLEQSTVGPDDASCKTACDGEEATRICDGIIDLVPFYADQNAECMKELGSCFEACSSEAGFSDALEDMGEAVCLLDGFNGNCDQYARGHEACGGTYADDSQEQCHAFCNATLGAWRDDLDTLCTDECGPLP